MEGGTMQLSWQAALRGAGITILALLGGTILGVALGELVFNLLPGHSIMNPNPVHILTAALPATIGFLAGSALWGIWMGRLAQVRETRRMAIAGMLGFAPITIGLALLLNALEPIAVDQLGAQVPVHRLFTFFFVPMAFLIAGTSAFALGIGLRDRALARRLFWQVGLAAGLAFLVVNLLMESSGWVVGAPGAAERATMVTVLFVGDLGAAIVGGGVLGVLLARAQMEARGQVLPAAVSSR
jgi:hypothetical protein